MTPPPPPPPCWNQSISCRYDGGTPEWCAPRMRATSPDRSRYRPSPTRPRLTLRSKRRKQAGVSGEPRMEEHSLCQISPKNEPYGELEAASRLFLLGNTSLWKWSDRPAPAVSGEERRRWRSLCGLTHHKRKNGLGSYAPKRRETRFGNREHK